MTFCWFGDGDLHRLLLLLLLLLPRELLLLLTDRRGELSSPIGRIHARISLHCSITLW